MDAIDKTGVRVRWLIAGAFSASPTGKRFSVTGAELPNALESAKLAAKVTVTDRLGADATRTFDVAFNSFKTFQVNEIVAAIPTLKELQSLAAGLASADPTKRPSPDDAVARIVSLVGDGKLAAAVRAKLGLGAAAPATPATPEAAPAAPATPAPAGDFSVDDLLNQAPAAPPKPAVSSAIGSFIKATRGATAPATTSATGRGARDVIEAEVFATASDVLREATVADLESSWRALKLVADFCPSGSGMSVDVLDTTPDTTIAAITAELTAVEQDEQPDAIFVFHPTDDIAKLTEYANLGADYEIPVVAGVTYAFFRVPDPHHVAARTDQEDGGLPKEWVALRNDEASRWLSVALNRVVLRTEGTGAVKRVVLGTPVSVIAAMLASSYHKTGAFAQILGEGAGFQSPGSWELPTGRDAGMLIPTEAYFSASTQAALAHLGFIALGSRRNTALVALKSAPTVRRGDDLVPLSAQVLTGRIVRFARWVLAQIPPKSPEPEVKSLFEQAATVFLFPAANESAKLEAQVVTSKDEKSRSVVLQVSANQNLAGIPFHLGFSLPLKD